MEDLSELAAEEPGLPPPVSRYVEHAFAGASRGGAKVRIEQSGEMLLKPAARPRHFIATEEFEVHRVAFAWRARFPLLGPVSLHVTDSYQAGEGLLEVRLLGLPLQRTRGPELARGEAYRYLAEIAWAPHAMLANPQLEWRQLDESTAEVSTSVGSEKVAVCLHFDETGDLMRTTAERPRTEARNALTPWIGEYREYTSFAGVRLPTHAEVRWELPGGPFTYWRCTVTSFEVFE